MSTLINDKLSKEKLILAHVTLLLTHVKLILAHGILVSTHVKLILAHVHQSQSICHATMMMNVFSAILH